METSIKLSTYPQVVTYFLRKYINDKSITDTENEIILSSEPPNKTL